MVLIFQALILSRLLKLRVISSLKHLQINDTARKLFIWLWGWVCQL